MKTHIRLLINKWIKEDREQLMKDLEEKFPNRKTLKMEEIRQIILGEEYGKEA